MSVIGDIRDFHSDEDKIVTEDGQEWLRTGYVEDDVASYPDAKVTNGSIAMDGLAAGEALILFKENGGGAMYSTDTTDTTANFSHYDGSLYTTSDGIQGVSSSNLSIGSWGSINDSGLTNYMFIFRQSEGFFDIVE